MSVHCWQIDDVGGRQFTYSQVVEHVYNCATSLHELGLQRTQRVCLLLPNCIELPVALLAVLRLGAVCVPFSPSATKCRPYTFSVYFLMRLSAAYLFLSKLMQTDTRRKKDFDPFVWSLNWGLVAVERVGLFIARSRYCCIAIPSVHLAIRLRCFFLVLYTNVITHNDRWAVLVLWCA